MDSVKIVKASGTINYDDNDVMWSGQIFFNSQKKEIIIYDTIHTLSEIQRANIIVEILEKYYFGNYLNYESELYLYKLKNRGQEKKEELNIKNDVSYNILSEYIIELPDVKTNCDVIKDLKSIYLNLKLSVNEAKLCQKKLFDKTKFIFTGNIFEYNKYKKILSNIIPDFEYALSKLYQKDVKIYMHIR